MGLMLPSLTLLLQNYGTMCTRFSVEEQVPYGIVRGPVDARGRDRHQVHGGPDHRVVAWAHRLRQTHHRA